jgi:ornithine carbamoyltransferase
MKSFIRLTDFSSQELLEIFKIADSMEQYEGFLKGKTVVMFFPTSSIRTIVTFEKGIYLLGGQVILFDPAALDKKEDIVDVCGYLNNWADVVVVRHRDIRLLEKMRDTLTLPVINAMTDDHPCEMIPDETVGRK